MRFWGIVTVLTLLFLSASAFALVTDLEKNIEIGETPEEISFEVENSSNIRQPLRIDYDFPTDFEIAKQAKYVRANSKEEVTVKIFPEYVFEGTTHKGKISITLGTNTAEKIVTLEYLKRNNCTVESNVEITEDKVIIGLTNNSFKDKVVRLTEVNNLPENWKIEGTKTFTLNGFEERDFELGLEKNSEFEGTLEFVFDCEREILREEVEITKEDEGLTGFAVLGGIGSALDFEIILNVFLGIIAAVLLIAFIARLIKILNKDGKQTKIEVEQ